MAPQHRSLLFYSCSTELMVPLLMVLCLSVNGVRWTVLTQHGAFLQAASVTAPVNRRCSQYRVLVSTCWCGLQNLHRLFRWPQMQKERWQMGRHGWLQQLHPVSGCNKCKKCRLLTSDLLVSCSWIAKYSLSTPVRLYSSAPRVMDRAQKVAKYRGPKAFAAPARAARGEDQASVHSFRLQGCVRVVSSPLTRWSRWCCASAGTSGALASPYC